MTDNVKKELDLTHLNVNITRNGVSVPFVPTQKKGEEGVYYPSPDKNWLKSNTSALMQFFGPDEVISIVIGKAKQWCQEWYVEALDSDGQFDAEKFAELVSSMSARGESIPDLVAQQMELIDALSELDLTEADAMADAKKISLKIKDIKEAINSKRRERKPKDENNTTTVPPMNTTIQATVKTI